MILRYVNNKFYLQCRPANSSIPRNLGLKWDFRLRLWECLSVEQAKRFSQFADEETKKSFRLLELKEQEGIKKSEASTSNLQVIIPEGLALYPYQIAGVEFLLQNDRSLLADDMGLGKTVQAIVYCNHIRPEKVLIICPASLKVNWAREWVKWSVLDISPIIINYDRLHKNSVELHKTEYDVLILDESQYLKNPKAKRTQEVFGKRAGKGHSVIPLESKKVIALTGTPILNRPIELFALLKYLRPDLFPNKYEFGKRFCNVKLKYGRYDYSGSSNLDELQKLLRLNLMIRRMKTQVLPELPKKVRQLIELEPNSTLRKKLSKQDGIFSFQNRNLTDKEFKEIVKKFSVGSPDFDSISKVRKETALAKLDMCIAHIERVLENVDKVVIFCHHTEIAESLRDEFYSYGSLMLTGKSTQHQRQRAVDQFQNQEKKRVFVGNIKAAGVGLTLTASSIVIFVEQSWTPAEMSQAEDRCCRIGQESTVLVQHLVLAGSLDYYMSKKLIEKQEIIERALDIPEFNLEDYPEDIRALLI